MAQLALTMEDIEPALSLAETLSREVQANVPLRHRLRAHGRAVFWALWHNLPDHLARHDMPAIQSFVTRAVSVAN